MRPDVEPYTALRIAIDNMPMPGILLNSISSHNKANTMTIGWGLLGWGYHSNPIAVVAVTPRRYTFGYLDEIGEFVLSVLPEELKHVVAYCGRTSGRDTDKFADANLTKTKSLYVKPPSIAEALVNLECRIYHKEHPPHLILTPEHRTRPVNEQHTMYFAEILGAYKYHPV